MTKGTGFNGPRPLPVRINKVSNMIHKPSTAAVKNNGQSAAKREPVIIYTHSPRVIHATISEFMTIVQKLTGVSCDEGEGEKATDQPDSTVGDEESFSDEMDGSANNGNESTTTSVGTDDQSLMMGDVRQDSTAVSPIYNMSNAFMLEAPLFAQNSTEFFGSSSMFPATNSISPSFMDYMKAFPEGPDQM